MPKQTYELWRSADGGQDSFFAAPQANEERDVESDATLIWTTEADSWNEVQQKRYDYMGWGHYRTIEEEERDQK